MCNKRGEPFLAATTRALAGTDIGEVNNHCQVNHVSNNTIKIKIVKCFS
jgi:hypothetical protein